MGATITSIYCWSSHMLKILHCKLYIKTDVGEQICKQEFISQIWFFFKCLFKIKG